MRFRDLIERLQPYEGISTFSTRVWINIRTGEAFTAEGRDGNHTMAVHDHPEDFGLTRQDIDDALTGQNTYDYDGRLLWLAMRKGWVRLRIDPRQPDFNSNIEAASTMGLRKALIWFLEKVSRKPKKLIVVIRNGPGDRDGQGYILDAEQIELFLQTGRIERDRLVNLR